MTDPSVSPDAFADALDAMVRGSRPAPNGEALPRFAHRLQATAALSVPMDVRASVWDRLMENRPAPAASVPPVAGGGAPAPPLPVVGTESTRRQRPDARNVHFIPASGGWIAMALLIVLVALAAAMFAGLGDDDPGFVPAASATERAPASPVASPSADCNVFASPNAVGEDQGGTINDPGEMMTAAACPPSRHWAIREDTRRQAAPNE